MNKIFLIFLFFILQYETSEGKNTPISKKTHVKPKKVIKNTSISKKTHENAKKVIKKTSISKQIHLNPNKIKKNREKPKLKVGEQASSSRPSTGGILGLRASLQNSTGIGYSGAVFSMIRLNEYMIIIPEIGFGISNTNIKTGGKKYELNSSYLFGNIFFAIKPAKPIAIYVGPTFNYVMSFDYKLENSTDKFIYTADKTSIGIVAGVGTSINRFYIDFRYQYFLTGNMDLELTSKEGNLQEIKTTFFENNIKFCIGYILF